MACIRFPRSAGQKDSAAWRELRTTKTNEEMEKAKRLKVLEEEERRQEDERWLNQPGSEDQLNEPKDVEAATQAATISHGKRKLYRV